MSPEPSKIAHYVVVSKLGEGGMGAVYRATDTKLNRDVAIKILPDSFAADPDRLARFTQEAQVLAQLNHPNIAAIYGVEEHSLVLELVDGPEVAGPIDPDDALPLLHQLIDALEYAHDKGIVHRDLKPANLKLTSDRRLKVLDFGLAKALSADPVAGTDSINSPTLTIRATMAGTIMGTAAYMAPEQARGHNVDKRADIWAFGVVVYELLTGKRLFDGPTVSDTLAAVLRQDVDFDSVPARFRKLLRFCLARDQRQRLRDIGDARVLLDEPETPAVTAAAPARRPLPWILTAAVCFLAAAALAVIHFRESAPEPQGLRFSVTMPAGVSIPALAPLALSPDGRKLAFVAGSKESAQEMLWIRDLDSLEARPIPGTELTTGGFPFWSPDSRTVPFSTGGKLKRVDLAGGAPLTIGDIGGNAPAAGHWLPDGSLYVPDGRAGIVRYSLGGGDPQPFTRTDTASAELFHGYPHVLPDGRMLVLIASTNAERSGVYLFSRDAKEKKRVVLTTHNFAYVPPRQGDRYGRLLFTRQETLVAQAIDPGTFELVGEPVMLAERLAGSLSLSQFAVSPAGLLAYRSGDRISARKLVWHDRAGGLTDPGLAGEYTSLALSPDGTRAIVTQTDPRAFNPDLWLLDLARNIPTRFTFAAAEDSYPAWSPDSAKVAFASRRNGPYELFVKDANGGSQEERLQKATDSESPTSWSPDGRFLMYVRNTRGITSLWVLENPLDPAMRKGSPYFETAYNVNQGQFSPGPAHTPRWVAYTSDESRVRPEIYVQSFPSGAGKFQISNAGGSQPRWRRDGKELFYMDQDGNLMAVEVKTSPGFQAGIPHPLFNSRLSNPTVLNAFRYDVSPDGRRFLLNVQAQAGAAAEPITVVTNWQAAMKR